MLLAQPWFMKDKTLYENHSVQNCSIMDIIHEEWVWGVGCGWWGNDP